MAYYKDAPHQRRKINHADQGSWDDEGTHYHKPASPARAARNAPPLPAGTTAVPRPVLSAVRLPVLPGRSGPLPVPRR